MVTARRREVGPVALPFIAAGIALAVGLAANMALLLISNAMAPTTALVAADADARVTSDAR